MGDEEFEVYVSSLWRKSRFEGARLQPCRKGSGINGALALEGLILSNFDFRHRLLCAHAVHCWLMASAWFGLGERGSFELSEVPPPGGSHVAQKASPLLLL